MFGIQSGHPFGMPNGGCFGYQFGTKYGVVFATFEQWRIFGYKNGTINAALFSIVTPDLTKS